MEPFDNLQRQTEMLDERLRELDWRIRLGDVEALSQWHAVRDERDVALHHLGQSMGAWERVALARDPSRPHAREAIEVSLGRFVELRGVRGAPDDPAVIGGVGMLGSRAVMAIGIERGNTADERLKRNYGMPGPDGFRKVQRLAQWAERHGYPVVTFIDTPGAYPGLESERGGVAEAIARTMWTMSGLRVPTCAVILGEGGSGGALALAVTDRILMMENAIFSVIGPEACASILWRDNSRAVQASELLRLTAGQVYRDGFVDELIPEPLGGAHRNPKEAMAQMRLRLRAHIEELAVQDPDLRMEARYRRFRITGAWAEN